MTILDRQHAAQLVTENGKVFFSDPAECIIYLLQKVDSSSIVLFLITTYDRPG